ncbi:unnamed protein product [Ectocarpus sp. 8 AP-2014]
MGPLALAPKRIKVRTISKARKAITNLTKLRLDGSESEVTVSKTHARMGFRCPVTIETIFDAPTEAQVAQFYSSRCPDGMSFSHLSNPEKIYWTESLRDNTTLMGFIVYSQLLPSLLTNRIKLNSATYHWAYLDPASEKGRIKLGQRREAVARLNRDGFTRSVFRGLPYGIDTAKSADATGKIDGTVLGAIHATFGEDASARVLQASNGKLRGGVTLFDDSVSGKLGEIMGHFDQALWRRRKKDKIERIVAANMDPAGLNKKIDGGKMLDPRDAKSIELMHSMLKGLSAQVWSPMKRLIGEALGGSMTYPSAFLRLSHEDEETLYKHRVKSGAVYTDIANLCTLLAMSYSFQRSQVLRDSTVDEYVLVPDGTHYRLVFQNRRFKTASSSGGSSAKPVSHFNLSSDQSMIVRFISSVGHRFCKVQDMGDEKRRLFLNSNGQNWTQKDIGTRFKKIGTQWLGIQNFCPHATRSFWATHALNTGQISGTNVEDFSSFLQVSSATLRNSYMSSGAYTAAHTLGSEVLGSVVNAACTGATTEEGAAPYGKKLNARRLEFVGQIRVSLAKYGGNGRLLFRDLMHKRKAGRLADDEKWFRFEATFFSEKKERLFHRFLDKNVTDV